jgi:hypothetical protein
LVLAVASALKLAESVPQNAMTTQAVGEVVLAGWLVFRGRGRLTACAMSLLFLVFAGYSAGRVTQHAASCGCFGGIPVPPALTLVVDAAIGLLWLRAAALDTGRLVGAPCRRLGTRQSRVIRAGAVVAVWLAVFSAGVFARPVPHVGAAWVGKPLQALFPDASARRMDRGAWMLLFYRPDCPVCARIMANFADLRARSPDAQWAVVVIGGEAARSTLQEPALGIALPMDNGALADALPSPLLIRSKDGTITAATLLH